jgi:hypothetical protein
MLRNRSSSSSVCLNGLHAVSTHCHEMCCFDAPVVRHDSAKAKLRARLREPQDAHGLVGKNASTGFVKVDTARHIVAVAIARLVRGVDAAVPTKRQQNSLYAQQHYCRSERRNGQEAHGKKIPCRKPQVERFERWKICATATRPAEPAVAAAFLFFCSLRMDLAALKVRLAFLLARTLTIAISMRPMIVLTLVGATGRALCPRRFCGP